ncbi:putative ribonuclease H-like domain-containing protein [Tanacetum coccineum]|uniref:Ribonuclease H-like domain-containing protein n=1 Tax=Tanacetum coccineum TaxID=301880 RepID=A0ABQ5A914_9ASTR
MYCLVVTDDFSRFSWVFFLATKDETSEILKSFISGIENLIDLRVKVIRCDNGTEFKNRVMNEFCEMKGIKREFSVARTPQQNGNRVLVIKPHNKPPYELFLGRKPALGFMRPFGCPITILNTIDHLGKFDGKADEGFFIGYSLNSKSFRVFNSRTRIVEENMHVQFSENTPNIAGSGPNWLFDIDTLTKTMNYNPIVAGNQSNGNVSTKASNDAGKTRVETVPGKDYILLPLWTTDSLFSALPKSSPDDGFKPLGDAEKKDSKDPGNDNDKTITEEAQRDYQEKDVDTNSTTSIHTVSTPVNVASSTFINVHGSTWINVAEYHDDLNMPDLEDIASSENEVVFVAEANMTNLDTYIPVIPIPTTRIHKDHLVEQIIGDIHSAPQTRRMTKSVIEHAMFSSVHQSI